MGVDEGVGGALGRTLITYMCINLGTVAMAPFAPLGHPAIDSHVVDRAGLVQTQEIARCAGKLFVATMVPIRHRAACQRCWCDQ